MDSIKVSERVIFRGRELPHKGLSWGQEFGGGLPAPVTGEGATGVWEGKVTLLRENTLQGGPSPYQGIYPKSGDELLIEITYGKKSRTLTPIVDSVKYTSAGVDIRLVQKVDIFNQGKIRIPPLVRTMPISEQMDYGTRYPNPSPMWHADYAFRKAGFFNTPPRSRATFFDLSCQGAIWCNDWLGHGLIYEAKGLSGEDPGPGYFIYDGAFYVRDASIVGAWKESVADSFRLSCLNPQAFKGEAVFRVHSATGGQGFTLALRADRRIQVYTDGQHLGTMSAAKRGSSKMVSLVVYGGRWEVAVENGESISGQTTFKGELSRIKITADKEAGLAGILLEKVVGLEHRILSWKRNLEIKYGPWTVTRPALPSVRDRTARQVLDEVAAKTFSAWWVDSEGIAHFESAHYLLRKPVSKELEATEHIAEYSFTDALLDSRSMIEVKHSIPAVSISQKTGLTVWDSGGGTANAGSILESFTGPEEGAEEWIEPDLTIRKAHFNISEFNSRSGSWCAAAKNTEDSSAPTVITDRFGVWAETITPWIFKIHEVYEEDCSRQIPEDPRFSRDLHGSPMPMLRARGKIQFIETSTVYEGGPRSAPALEVDCTKYVTNPEMASEIAQFLGGMLFRPLPYHSVTAIYDPFIELGDVVRVRGERVEQGQVLYGAVLKCQVAGYTSRPEEGVTELTLRIIEEEKTFQAWEQVEQSAAISGITWADAEAAAQRQALTWADAEADPTLLMKKR